LRHVKKLVHEYKPASFFGAKSIAKLIIVTQLSLVQLLQKYDLHA